MVWGCFINNQPGPLVLVKGKLNADGYIEILQKNLLPFLSQLGPNTYIFQEDNAPIHTAKKVAKWKGENMVISFSWPAQSPDLNPIEHVWDRLERGIRGRTSPPKNLNELATAVEEEWSKLDPNYLEDTTLDGLNTEWFDKTAKDLIEGRFKFTPARQILI